MVRFTVSIRENIKQQLDDYAEANDLNRSKALEAILKKHFEQPVSPVDKPLETESEPLQTRPGRIDDIEANLLSVMHFLAEQYHYLVSIDEKVDTERTGPEVPYPAWCDQE